MIGPMSLSGEPASFGWKFAALCAASCTVPIAIAIAISGPTAEDIARRENYKAWMDGSTVVRICADGTHVRSTERGKLFMAFRI